MPFSVMCSQVPVSASARDRELPSATSLPARVNLGLVLGEGEDGHANQVATTAAASEGSASLGEPEDDGIHSHHSHSPASSQCSATYSNLGKQENIQDGDDFLKIVSVLSAGFYIMMLPECEEKVEEGQFANKKCK